MPKIRVLSDILASQVAAGEVVERPASVVKELVENSIDAGAREIRVDVDRGGAALIRVTDDGCGMSREDALLALERHATSKLRVSADLADIRTLGFRGEAVPSIASVSRFRMVTREPDQTAGTEIFVDGGKLRDVKDAGCAPGTIIEAKSLFYNMPARKKFMRAESTETAHVEHQVRLHALAAPMVRFRLRRDDKDVFDLPAAPHAVDKAGNDGKWGHRFRLCLVGDPRAERPAPPVCVSEWPAGGGSDDFPCLGGRFPRCPSRWNAPRSLAMDGFGAFSGGRERASGKA
jgi:DNA mismatch repair protein MutL